MSDMNYDAANTEAAQEAVAMLPRLQEITEYQEVAATKASDGTLFADMEELPRLQMQTMLLREQTEGFELCSDMEHKLGLAAEDDPERLARLTAISYRPEVCRRVAGPEAIQLFRALRQRFLAAADTLTGTLKRVDDGRRAANMPPSPAQGNKRSPEDSASPHLRCDEPLK